MYGREEVWGNSRRKWSREKMTGGMERKEEDRRRDDIGKRQSFSPHCVSEECVNSCYPYSRTYIHSVALLTMWNCKLQHSLVHFLSKMKTNVERIFIFRAFITAKRPRKSSFNASTCTRIKTGTKTGTRPKWLKLSPNVTAAAHFRRCTGISDKHI